MKRLIRNKTTGAFLTQDGKWTDDFHKAWDLPEYRQAFALRDQLGLRDVEVFYCYDDEATSETNFTVSLD